MKLYAISSLLVLVHYTLDYYPCAESEMHQTSISNLDLSSRYQ